MDLPFDVVDFHTHILPGADHGSDSVKTTLRQLELARDAGVRRLIATSHFYPTSHSVDSFLKRRDGSYSVLSGCLSDDLPEILLGAEVLMCPGIENMEGVERLCIEGTKTLLLELPFSDFSLAYKTSVACLVSRGIDVVLAHADRYEPKNIDIILQAGARIQLNASALSGVFVNADVKRWIADGYVVALGSDIHMNDESAYRKFVKATRKLYKMNEKAFEYSDMLWNAAKAK